MDTSTLIGTYAFFEHIWETLQAVTLDGDLLTGAIAGMVLGLTVASVLWLIGGSRYRSERQRLMKTVMETRQELLKVSSLYSVQCQVSEVSRKFQPTLMSCSDFVHRGFSTNCGRWRATWEPLSNIGRAQLMPHTRPYAGPKAGPAA